MPEIDVNEAFECVEFADRFDVLRRCEDINTQDRSEVSTYTFPRVAGAVYPTGDNSLVRTEDYQIGRNILTIVTRFRL